MQFLYSLGIQFYYLAIKAAALYGNKKARKWLVDRIDWEKDLKKAIPQNADSYWFHVASLGEYEQAVPIITAIKEKHPHQFILLTFFSPSGYRKRKNDSVADYVSCLPLDLKKNAKRFIQLAKPKKVFFIKYEFWFNFLGELNAQQIDTYLVSGVFRPSQLFFQFYGAWFRNKLHAFSHFFLQNQTSKNVLSSIGFSNITVTGDTRLDRVSELAKEDFENAAIQSFCKDSEVFIFGSSWAKENEIAVQLSNSSLATSNRKIIVAPHEIDSTSIKQLKSKFHSNVRLWSDTNKNESLEDCKILIIDSIGILSKLYRFGKYAFIGGGFGKGIHNILEPLAYKIPVFFGPNYTKFHEAVESIQLNIGFSITNFIEFETILKRFESDSSFQYEAIQKRIQTFFSSNLGATQKITELILRD